VPPGSPVHEEGDTGSLESLLGGGALLDSPTDPRLEILIGAHEAPVPGNPTLCAVRALDAWQGTAGVTEGALFSLVGLAS